jgi:LPS export ABC transporter protein LptC
MQPLSYRVLALVIALFTFWGCGVQDDAVPNMEEYTGPLMELDDVTLYYSDSAIVKIKLEAEQQLNLQNGDQEYPKGMYLEFYDNQSQLISTMRADYAYYNSEESLWRATGNVVIVSQKENRQLDTEELFWDQREKKVFTEKFVRIEQDDEIIMGEGLEAPQDFSDYTLKKARGTIMLEQQP